MTTGKPLARQAIREMYAACEKVAEAAEVPIRFFIIVAAADSTRQPHFDCGGNGTRALSVEMLGYAIGAHAVAREDVDK